MIANCVMFEVIWPGGSARAEWKVGSGELVRDLDLRDFEDPCLLYHGLLFRGQGRVTLVAVSSPVGFADCAAGQKVG